MPIGSHTPKLYSLLKIHMEMVMLRPILSMNNSAKHQLVKWLVDVLSPLTEAVGKNTLKNRCALESTDIEV